MSATTVIISINMKNIQARNKRYRGMIQYLQTLISTHNPDVICMQEITRPAISALSADLQLPHIQWSPYGYLGVGMISKHPMSLLTSVKLENRRGIIPRTAQIVKIYRQYSVETHEDMLTPITICNLHLCHQSEDNRLYQLSRLANVLKDDYSVDFLVGDFNAVHFNDYSDIQLTQIQQSRHNYALEPARNDAMQYVLQQLQYYIPPYQKPTCPYNTRVDYICPSISHNYSYEYIVDDTSMTQKYTDHCTSILKLIKPEK